MISLTVVDEVPSYSIEAKAAHSLLYSDLQDIDIYVEDSSLKEVYNVVVRRFELPVRFHSVIPIGCKEDVIGFAKSNKSQRTKCYLVDGDLRFALEDERYEHLGLFVHGCYCFENYLFCEDATCCIVHEQSGKISPEEARERVDWNGFRAELESMLVSLYIVYAAAHSLHPSIETTKRSLGPITVNREGKFALDSVKVETEINRVKAELSSRFDANTIDSLISTIRNRVSSLPDPLMIVSGKELLLKFLKQRIFIASGAGIQSEGMLMRLAKNANLNRFAKMKAFIENCI